jgi:hypothetical protein
MTGELTDQNAHPYILGVRDSRDSPAKYDLDPTPKRPYYLNSWSRQVLRIVFGDDFPFLVGHGSECHTSQSSQSLVKPRLDGGRYVFWPH